MSSYLALYKLGYCLGPYLTGLTHIEIWLKALTVLQKAHTSAENLIRSRCHE